MVAFIHHIFSQTAPFCYAAVCYHTIFLLSEVFMLWWDHVHGLKKSHPSTDSQLGSVTLYFS